MPSNFLSSLSGLFSDSTEDSPIARPGFTIPPAVDIPGLDAGTTSTIDQLRTERQPLLERRNKLMEQLYQPDHLSYGGMIGQALTAFLPVLLGKAMAGNAGGAAGAVAGAQGLKTWQTLDAQRKQDEQRKGLADINSLESEIKGNIDLEKTLREGGVQRQQKMQDAVLEQSQYLPGSPRYNFEMDRMSMQHKNRMGEMSYAKSLANDGSSGNGSADPAVIESTKYAIEQRFGKDSPEAQNFISKLSNNTNQKAIEEMRRQLGLGDPEKRDSSLTEASSARLYDRVIKPVEQNLNKDFDSAKNLLMLLDNNSGITAGAVRGQWARVVAGEKGVLTDRDINRNLSSNSQADLARLMNYFNNAPDNETFSAEYKQMIKNVLLESAQLQLDKYSKIDKQLGDLAPTISKYAYEQDPKFYSQWTSSGKERLNSLLGNSSQQFRPQFTREEIERKKAEIRARGGN